MERQWNSKTAINKAAHLSSPNASIGDMVSSKTVFPIKPSGMTSGLVCFFCKIAAVLCILQFALCNSTLAAPHITREKPEPFHGVGKRLSERMKAGMFAPMMAPTIPPSSYPTAIKVLFLRVDFQPNIDPQTTGDGTWTDTKYACNADLEPGTPSPVATDPLCTANPYDYWVNRAKQKFIDYYNEVSYGQLTLQVTISPVYHLTKNMAYYGDESTTALQNLIRDSVTAADPDIDFTQYVSPNGGILIVHAGAGEETDTANNTTNDLWSLYYGAGTTIVSADNVNISEAIIMPQTGTQDGRAIDPLGIYVHEFGHWLGLPDLYDTGVKEWDGPGKWSLMADGMYLPVAAGIRGSSPSHLDAWCKSYLGWVTPQTISTDFGPVTLSPVETNKQIIKVLASTTTSQYFLLENRQQTGFDSGLPGGGLLVWLIDEALTIAQIPNNAVNNNPVHPGVALTEADGNQNLKNYNDGDYGSAGDPFPGTSNKTSFTPYTNPSSTPYTGSAWLYLKDIATDVSNNVTLTIGFAPIPPTNLSYTLNSSTRLTWTASADAAKYIIYKNGFFLAETTETQYTDGSASNGTYAVSAVDANGYESAKSATVTVTPSSGVISESGGGGCFIATAAYGSYEAPYVMILREFRDSYLLTNGAGKMFVRVYYNVSPPVADFIRESETLKGIVRVMLLPLIGIAAFLLKTSLVQKILIFGVAGIWVYKRERERPPTPSLVKRGCRQAGS